VVIGEVSGLDADRPETWYRDPPLAWDIVPMWGHQAQWDIRPHPALHRVWSALWGTSALLVTLDRCRFTPPWRDGQNPPRAFAIGRSHAPCWWCAYVSADASRSTDALGRFATPPRTSQMRRYC
jgi:hypothetical protein